MPADRVRVPGHFGELLQGRMGAHGPVALVSLPCPVLTVTGAVMRGAGLSVHGAGQRLLTLARARALLARLGLRLPGRIILRATMPVGGGAGSSTAALVALARLAGWTGPAETLARACVAVEGASDPLMFPAAERMLWASRRGDCLQTLPPLPRFDVVGGFFGPGARTDAHDQGFCDMRDLVAQWCAAAARGDLPALAQLATTSARRSLDRRAFSTDPMDALARCTGALGWMVAHTGSARGLIFAPGCAPRDAAGTLRGAGFHGVLRFTSGEAR